MEQGSKIKGQLGKGAWDGGGGKGTGKGNGGGTHSALFVLHTK